MKEQKEIIAIETTFPGTLVGREVQDARGECIGIVRSIEVDFSTMNTNLLLYGSEGTKEIPLKDVDHVGERVELKKTLLGEEIEQGDERKIKRKVKKEIKSLLTVSSILMGS